MDSKVLRNTLFLTCLFMAAVFVAVLYANGMWPGQKEKEAASQVLAVQEAGQDGETALSGQAGGDLSGWMADKAFFDEAVQEDTGEEGTRLSLIATSVEKDLRVQVVDSEGRVVEGEFFTIQMDNGDEYADLDRDGVIYVADLASGEYQLTLLEEEGYVVPASTLPVKVKARVEYVAIGDISLLIKTEQEVDAMKEDGESGDDEAQEEGYADIRTSEEAAFGIDVSRWNEAIDWEKVKEQGVEFAIIRVGYRGSVTGSLVEDYYFRQNIEGATAAGIDVGLYFFTQAVNQVEAVEEASMALELCQGYDLAYPIFIDTEGAGGDGRADGLDAATRTSVCEAFCETIRSSGYEAGIYASKNWFNNNLVVGRLPDNIVIWLAEYKDAPTYEGAYQLWQYSSSGRIPGIEGRVDLNLSFMP